MAKKQPHWKEKDGRFWARIAVPKDLQATLGKTELIEPLGGDRRVAVRNHAAAVARLRDKISRARALIEPSAPQTSRDAELQPLTVAVQRSVAWSRYMEVLAEDRIVRESLPIQAEIDEELRLAHSRAAAGEVDVFRNPIGALTYSSDYELKAGARHFYSKHRTRRSAALRSALLSGETRLVDQTLAEIVARMKLSATPGSREWADLAHVVIRAELEALERTFEEERGVFNGLPADPIVQPSSPQSEPLPPLALKKLFKEYIAGRQVLGKHKDGAKAWERAIVNLISFLGHSDARKVSKRNLLDWRDDLLAKKLSPKTISDVHLASVRALFRWAFANDKLPTDEGSTVRQEIPKKVRSREKGYTDKEALAVLRASVQYRSPTARSKSTQESSHVSLAKRWIPLLCAFTGARVTEMAQLRKEDVRRDGDGWIVRVTPEAGSVKTSEYRDVPLHRQILALGFAKVIEAAQPGPLFHAATDPEKFLASARATSGRISVWLQRSGLVPEGVQPSHGWRHRFKTQGRELDLSDRVIDAIQGHAGTTAGDSYGDVTRSAKQRAIEQFPDYDLAANVQTGATT